MPADRPSGPLPVPGYVSPEAPQLSDEAADELLTRIAGLIQQADGCWLWQGSTTHRGDPRIKRHDGWAINVKAFLFSSALVPEGICQPEHSFPLFHATCPARRRCVRPEHHKFAGFYVLPEDEWDAWLARERVRARRALLPRGQRTTGVHYVRTVTHGTASHMWRLQSPEATCSSTEASVNTMLKQQGHRCARRKVLIRPRADHYLAD